MYEVCDYCLEPICDIPEFHGQSPMHSQCMEDLCREMDDGYPYELDGNFEFDLGGESWSERNRLTFPENGV